MMDTAIPFSVTRSQATRLQAYIHVYRQYVFTSILPSVERNSMLRTLQAIQGKLFTTMEQRTTSLQLVLTCDEMAILKAVVSEMLLFYTNQPESPERIVCVGDLAAFKNSLKEY